MTLEFFPELSRTFIELSEFSKFRDSDKSLSHKLDSIAAALVASWSLTQQVAGSSPFTAMTNIFVTEFIEFLKNI